MIVTAHVRADFFCLECQSHFVSFIPTRTNCTHTKIQKSFHSFFSPSSMQAFFVINQARESFQQISVTNSYFRDQQSAASTSA
jgi:hypothetical protein